MRTNHLPYRPLAILLSVLFGVVALSWLTTYHNTPDDTPLVEQITDRQPFKAADVPEEHFGYQPNPQATRKFLAQLPRANLREAAPQLFQADPPQDDIFLYRALYDAHLKKYGVPWQVGRQGIGDCVSFGFAHGADIHLAVMWSLGDSADWKPTATESIYGGSRVEARGVSRGGWSDGSYGSAAAKWLREYGLVFRQPYETVDLSRYSAQRAKDWGNYGNGGQDDNGRLDAEARKHPVRTVALVRNFAEASAAIHSGYPVPVCSMVGFRMQRDADGFAQPQGTWPHCMCFIAARHGKRPGLLCLNSWGPNWITGPKYPSDMPDGSFWVDQRTVDRMLAQNDSFAVSGYDGFPFRKLDHAKWVQAMPVGDNEPNYALAP
ncbi:hypothetical protein DTL42_18415 [Bremerella cremea]|uniref:Peptidase C1A papain C-terminal domain-containing protein n=1 Tax=Bremerella cremea TaxID=1031537 RepID=A0A368KRB0_9BACT|nr:hypothetical protein [Bremerella cremea]RCS43961.1 hypothetical protein DTL42_18415 [Bremerella cremea]